jgi:hypothetical protein
MLATLEIPTFEANLDLTSAAILKSFTCPSGDSLVRQAGIQNDNDSQKQGSHVISFTGA